MLGFECRRAVVQEPRAGHSATPRHSSSSSGKAHLPAPLVLAARSRRRRSAHRKEDLEEAVLHVQNQLAKSGGRARHICRCRKLSVLVVPASHNRLADEAGHDDRAGLGLGHHDEQSMPSKHQHKPAQLHVASIAMLVVAPQLLNTRKVASKLTTSSCSNAAVGEKVARRRIEPTNPHRRHGRRSIHPSTSAAIGYLSCIYLSIYPCIKNLIIHPPCDKLFVRPPVERRRA